MTGKLALLASDVQARLEALVNEAGGRQDLARRRGREVLKKSWLAASEAADDGAWADYLLAAIDFLQKELRWHKTVLDQVPAPISVYDLNLRWSYINPAAADLIGLDQPGSFLGKRYRDGWKYYAADDGDPAEDGRDSLKRLMRPLNQAGKFLVSHSAFLTDENEQPVGLIETLREAREEEEAFELLTEEAEARRQLLEATPLPCLYFERDGKLVDCNEQAVAILGLPDRKTLLRCFHLLLAGEGLDDAQSLEILDGAIHRALAEEAADCDGVSVRSASGLAIECRIRFSRILWRGREAVLASLYPQTKLAPQVLVVDDIEVNQLMAAGLIKRLGYRVKTASNGRQALEMVRVEKFDLIFMDLEMPHMNGLEATREIRALPEGRRLPIISWTSHNSEESLAACLAAGMNGHLGKPFDLSGLKLCLEKWFGPPPEGEIRAA